MNSNAVSDTINFKINDNSDEIIVGVDGKYWIEQDARVAVAGAIRTGSKSIRSMDGFLYGFWIENLCVTGSRS